MGVIHKLREDVVKFILTQKAATPAISCRQLSEIVSTAFKTRISKSSVNAVLFDANLSSPVGRRTLSGEKTASQAKKPIAKFRIPEHRKKELFGLSRDTARQDKATPAASVPKKAKRKGVPGQSVFADPPVPARTEKQEMSNLKTPAIQFAFSTPERVEKAGLIFLKIAEWNLAGGSILGKIFKEEFAEPSGTDCQQAGDIALFAGALEDREAPSEKSSVKPRSLRLAGISGGKISEEVLKIGRDAAQIRDIGMKASVEIDTVLPRVATIKIQGGGQEFVLDASGKVLDGNVQSEVFRSLPEVIRYVTADIINNVQSAVLFCPNPETEKIKSLFQGLDQLFDNDPRSSLQEVSLLDPSGAELAKYSGFSSKKRKFVLAVAPDAELISKITGQTGAVEVLALPFLPQELYYQVFSTDVFSTRKSTNNAVTLRCGPEEKPFLVLLGNESLQNEDLKEAVSNFLQSWPGLVSGGGAAVSAEKGQARSKGGLPAVIMDQLVELGSADSLEAAAALVRKVLGQWFQAAFLGLKDNFLDGKTLQERFFDLPGDWQENERFITIFLIPSAGYSFFTELDQAVQQINRDVIRDPRGRRLVFATLPPKA